MMSIRRQSRYRRRAAAVAIVAVTGTLLVGFAALAIDMGMLYSTRAEAQRAADAGALAGAWKLLSNDALKASGMATVVNVTRQTASSVANQNKVYNSNPTVDQNTGNSGTGDVVLGRLDNPSDHAQQLQTQGATSQYNATKVLIHRDATRNGPIPLIFAQVFGFSSKEMTASAVAAFQDNIIGFQTPPNGGNAQILPIVVDAASWQALLNGTLSHGDGFTFNPATNTASSGGDGIKELNIWPGGGGNQGGAGNGGGSLQLTPGNWGTVKIGVDNNSTATLGAQIRYGITPAQMATFPNGQMTLNSNGQLSLGGNPGMSNGIKDDLTAIIGQGRTVPLYSTVVGNGNNTTYTIVGFAGVRIMAVSLTGNPGNRYVLAQPAMNVDAGAITGGTGGTSYHVYKPPTLVR